MECHKVAKQMMTTIKADLTMMAKQDTRCTAAAYTKHYIVCRSREGMHLSIQSQGITTLRNISASLKFCLRECAAAECLAIVFDVSTAYERVVVRLSC